MKTAIAFAAMMVMAALFVPTHAVTAENVGYMPSFLFMEGNLSGLTVEDGPTRDVTRRRTSRSETVRTLRITAVEQGSAADRSSLKVGDIVLLVDDWPRSNDLVTDVEKITNKVYFGGEIELRIEGEKGNQRDVILSQPPLQVTPFTISNVLELQHLLSRGDRGFPDKGPRLGQLMALARTLNIPEREISNAIADGRLVPAFHDLISAFNELSTADCGQIRSDLPLKLPAEPPAKIEAIGRIDCSLLRIYFDDAASDIWNQRFGPPPTRLLPRRDLLTRAGVKLKTVVAILAGASFPRTYPMMRCDFTTALRQVSQVPVVCGRFQPQMLNWKTRPENKQLAQATGAGSVAKEQLEAARRSDVFGGADDPISTRLRLFADGSFEALDELAIEDMGARYAEYRVTPIGYHKPGSPPPRYTPLIAGYIATRMHWLGACGDRLGRLGKAVTDIQQRKTIGGVVLSQQDLSYRVSFEAPSRFLPIVRAHIQNPLPGESGFSSVRGLFTSAFEKLKCASPERQRLEDNMIAYAMRAQPNKGPLPVREATVSDGNVPGIDRSDVCDVAAVPKFTASSRAPIDLRAFAFTCRQQTSLDPARWYLRVASTNFGPKIRLADVKVGWVLDNISRGKYMVVGESEMLTELSGLHSGDKGTFVFFDPNSRVHPAKAEYYTRVPFQIVN